MWVRTDRGGSGWIGPTDEKLRGGETENKCSTIIVFGVSPPFSVQSQRCIILTEITVEPRVRFHTSVLNQEDGDGTLATVMATAERPKWVPMAGGSPVALIVLFGLCDATRNLEPRSILRELPRKRFAVKVLPNRLPSAAAYTDACWERLRVCVLRCVSKTHPSKLWFSFSKVY